MEPGTLEWWKDQAERYKAEAATANSKVDSLQQALRQAASKNAALQEGLTAAQNILGQAHKAVSALVSKAAG